MILIGHPDVQSQFFYRVDTIEHIASTPSQSVVLFDYQVFLCEYCKANGIAMAIHVRHIKELMLAHALGASFLVVDKALAIHAQKIADDYLFDSKILLLGHDDEEIEFAALNGVDGILFERGIVRL